MLVCGKEKNLDNGVLLTSPSFWFPTNHDYRREQNHYGWFGFSEDDCTTEKYGSGGELA
jgi:hypothetical protein